jgi:hypothetical protein
VHSRREVLRCCLLPSRRVTWYEVRGRLSMWVANGGLWVANGARAGMLSAITLTRCCTRMRMLSWCREVLRCSLLPGRRVTWYEVRGRLSMWVANGAEAGLWVANGARAGMLPAITLTRCCTRMLSWCSVYLLTRTRRSGRYEGVNKVDAYREFG